VTAGLCGERDCLLARSGECLPEAGKHHEVGVNRTRSIPSSPRFASSSVARPSGGLGAAALEAEARLLAHLRRGSSRPRHVVVRMVGGGDGEAR
jgi:hypothetical protein